MVVVVVVGVAAVVVVVVGVAVVVVVVVGVVVVEEPASGVGVVVVGVPPPGVGVGLVEVVEVVEDRPAVVVVAPGWVVVVGPGVVTVGSGEGGVEDVGSSVTSPDRREGASSGVAGVEVVGSATVTAAFGAPSCAMSMRGSTSVSGRR